MCMPHPLVTMIATFAVLFRVAVGQGQPEPLFDVSIHSASTVSLSAEYQRLIREATAAYTGDATEM